MRVDCALLCDAVTVRDGLLHILGGGITRILRPEFPAPLGAALAVRVMVHPTEADAPHHFEARLIAEDGEAIGQIGVGFEVEAEAAVADGNMRPGEEFSTPFSLNIHQIAIPRAGAYSFELLIDGIHSGSIPFVIDEDNR